MRPRPATSAPDAGMVTAEAAVVLPVLVLVGVLAMAGVSAVLAQARCLEAASLAARLTARGEPADVVASTVAAAGPRGAQLTVTRGAGVVAATVRIDVGLPGVGTLLPPFVVQASAAAAVEPGAPP